MKNIRELTDTQIVEIGRLAMSEFIDFEDIIGYLNMNRSGDFKFKITKEVYDKEGGRDLLVIRTYLDGYGDTYFHIWENTDQLDIDVVVDGRDYHCANIVPIVKNLIEWGFA